MGAIEALYIFDEHNNAVLEHNYAGRPASPSVVLAGYLAQPPPRPAVTFLPNVNPPSLICGVLHDRLLLLCTTTTDTDPLLVVEFLNRFTDALEEFLGGPLLASKIEASYDIVAQIIDEICDAGLVCNTEPNSLQEAVETPSWMGSILGGFGLPSASPSLPARSSSPSLPGIGPNTLRMGGPDAMSSIASIPWRKAGVRHTSNELYVDIVEQLSVVLAPSGRPLSAIANGAVIFTAKISGIPDLNLTLTAPGGKAGINQALALPTFHPCVRLARWSERPGELSFVPPDGRFVLAGYECDLLPGLFALDSQRDSLGSKNLKLPATLEMNTGLGIMGDEIEVRLLLPLKGSVTGAGGGPMARSAAADRLRAASPAFGSSVKSSPSAPVVEDIVVRIPLPAGVRNVSDLRTARGEAHFLASEAVIEWRVPTKEANTITSAGATLRCTIVGQADELDQGDSTSSCHGVLADTFDYADDAPEITSDAAAKDEDTHGEGGPGQTKSSRTQVVMPRSANISFSLKGWLASGVRVDRLEVNTKASKGLGAGVTPYKGVKYHTVSRQGIELRC